MFKHLSLQRSHYTCAQIFPDLKLIFESLPNGTQANFMTFFLQNSNLTPQSDAVVLTWVPFEQHALFLIKFDSLLQLLLLVSYHPPVKCNSTPTVKQKWNSLTLHMASPFEPSMILYPDDPFILFCLMFCFLLIYLIPVGILQTQHDLPPSVHANTSIIASWNQ